MNVRELRMRLIASLAAICFFATVGGRAAQAQRSGTFPPTSGAMITISGTAGTEAVNITIYDSQIHSGVVQPVPLANSEINTSNCNATDVTYPTDAYVLQGGSWTGCDTGDAFEVTDNNPNNVHQAPGTATVSGFALLTHYICGGSCDGGITGTPFCNTSGTICSNPDSGELTVTNGTGYPFIGTIALQGTSSIQGGSSCAVGGVAFDSVTYTSETPLAAGGIVSLILGTEGNGEAPGYADSSNCGGFNAPQTLPITTGLTTIFHFGNDDLQITPASNTAGDTLTLLPVPVPAGPLTGNNFGSESLAFTTTPFYAGSTYPTEASIPYADFSANKNPVGLELQLTCTPAVGPASDCATFINTSEVDFNVDPNSFPSGIGGVQFLAEHDNPPAYNGTCPTEGFNVDILFSYTAPVISDPIKGHSLGNSCFVTTFSPTAPAVAPGTTVTSKTFEGFYLPVLDTKLNYVEDGLPVALSWQTFDNVTGKPVTNLTVCPNSAGTGCTAPWVSIGTFPINCTSDAVDGSLIPAPGKALFLNYKNGLYTYFLNTVRGSSGCFTPVLTFSTTYVSYSVANFKFI